MLRLIFAVVVTSLLLGSASASAQGYGHPYSFPIYGSGFVYDPYETGKFKAPDMHNDPLFRAQHKFDSHFPGRYRTSPQGTFPQGTFRAPSKYPPLEWKTAPVQPAPRRTPARMSPPSFRLFRNW